MFKLFVFAAVVAIVSASGYHHEPVVHSVAVHKTIAVPTVVGHSEKVVGSQVVGYNTHHNVHHVPKVITQAHHIVKPATWQQSSGHSIPATGKVISAPIITHHAPVYAHAGK